MKKIFSERAGEILMCLIIFLITLGYFSLVTDDYAYFMSSLASRQFSDFAYFDVHFQGFIGIREVYKLFYRLIPRINWHFVFSLLYEILSLYILLRTLRVVVLKNTSPFFIYSVQFLFALAFIENIIFISHTRVSLLFCGLALFNLVFTKSITRKQVISNSVLFVFGMLLRPESSMGTLLLVGLGYCIYTVSLLGVFKRLWLPILSTAIFFTVFAIDWFNTDIYVRKIEPEIEYKMMARRVVPIGEMKTLKDSVKYEAAQVGMWFDMKEMSPKFLRSIILPGVDLSVTHARDIFLHVTDFYLYYIFIACTIVSLLLTSFLFLPDFPIRIFKILLFSICTFAIIYMLDYNGFLVSNRHFLSLQIISLLILTFYFFDASEFYELKHKGGFVAVILIGLFTGVCFTVIRYRQENVLANESVNSMVKTMKEFERRYSNRIVAITIDNRFFLDQHFLLTNQNYSANTYLMFDWFTFHLTPRYINYLCRICDCEASDPVAFFKWLTDNHALYMSVPFRYDLTQRYLHAVHGLNIKFDDPVRLNGLSGIDNSDTKDCEVRTVSLVDRR